MMVGRLMVRARQEQSWGTPSVLWAFLTMIEAAPDLVLTITRKRGNSVKFTGEERGGCR
jgi:hypothetical protein